MKKATRFSIFLTLLFSVFSIVGLTLGSPLETKADQTTNYPRNGSSGTVLYVNGAGTYFNSGAADLAIYCFNSESVNAWSDRVSYRVHNDILRVMIPYRNGESMTWSNFIVCRYNPSLDPATNGFDGVYNQTANIPFSSMLYAQNTVNITGYGDGGSLNYVFSSNDYYGIKGENHMYLDLSGFPSWEEGGAKFAIYFAYPHFKNEVRWSQSYSKDGYFPSFCWKVNGQDNAHLYECIVPNIASESYPNLWNMVIAVRFGPEASSPNWEDNKWNQTQNLSFNSSNHEANMIRITGWDAGQLDTENVISRDSRLEFYGRYFLDTVVCSGTGESDATSDAMWSQVKDEYVYHLSRVYQGVVWMCDPSASETLLAQAMARYDYIVFYKEYAHEDFINRAESPAIAHTLSHAVTGSEANDPKTFIIIASIILVTVVSGAVLAKIVNRKKHF